MFTMLTTMLELDYLVGLWQGAKLGNNDVYWSYWLMVMAWLILSINSIN